jgi:hypothetical protein
LIISNTYVGWDPSLHSPDREFSPGIFIFPPLAIIFLLFAIVFPSVAIPV